MDVIFNKPTVGKTVYIISEAARSIFVGTVTRVVPTAFECKIVYGQVALGVAQILVVSCLTDAWLSRVFPTEAEALKVAQMLSPLPSGTLEQ